LELRRGSESTAAGLEAALDDAELGTEQRCCLLCRTCGNYVSTPDEICRPDGQSSEYTFENPAGRVCEILALQNAWALELVGSPTLEHTWFPGCTWRVALCARCGRQLGWCFEAAAGTKFFGLLVKEICSGPAPAKA
jgi:cereblon